MGNKKEVVSEETTVATESKTAKKAIRKFAPDDLIVCRSITFGELLLTGKKSKLLYSWANYGDTTEVEYQDLQALKSTRSSYLFKPRFIIEDEELVEQWGSMLNPIYSKIQNQDIEALFELDPAQFEAILSKMPVGIKDSVKTKAAQKIANEELNDIRIIKTIDKLLGTELAASLLN